MPYTRRSTLRARGGVTKKRKSYSGRRPARFAPKSALRTYKKARVMSKALSAAVSESKVLALNTLQDVKPVSINGTITGNRVTVAGFVLDTLPATWSGPTGMWNDLGGMTMPQGTGPAQRVGSYAFLKKSTGMVNIKMKPLEEGDYNGPVKFRVIHFVEKRRAAPSGLSDDPSTSLFIDTAGKFFGSYSSSSVDGSDIWQSILNKRDWTILSDKKFTLQSPSMYEIPGVDHRVAQITKYPAEKNLRFNANFYKKVHFGSSDKPDDVNYKHGYLIYAMYTGQTNANPNICDDWVVDFRGSTSLLDG